jgi:tetratricopeptide (TPR) repeat protein
MVNKKKDPPSRTKQQKIPAKATLQNCQDLYEKAMLDAEEDRWPGFKKHLNKAIKEAELLFAEVQNAPSGGDDIEEVKEFLAQSCFEMGTYVLEEDEDDLEGTRSATQAKPLLERAIELFKSQPDVSQSFYRPTVVALSEAYSILHLHDQDIAMCEEFLARLTKQYNVWTPLQNEVLEALGQAYNKVGRLEDAERVYKEIVSLCKLNFGDDNERTAEAEEELLEFLEERDFAVCECKRTKEETAKLGSQLPQAKQLQKADH